MEMFDVLDGNGLPTGEVKSREAVHSDGDWHRTVHVWLINPKGDLLLQLRGPHQEANPNCWDISCAGHLDAGEEKLNGARRELFEELGLKLSLDRFQFLTTCRSEFVSDGITDREFSEIYLVEWKPGDGEFVLCPKEVVEVRWMPWAKLREKVEQEDAMFVNHDQEYTWLFNHLKDRDTNLGR